MDRETALSILRRHADLARQAGVKALYLYGSVSRDVSGPDSDVDLYVDPDYDRFDFVELIRLEEKLASVLGRPVELTTREGLHPRLRQAIEADAIAVFS